MNITSARALMPAFLAVAAVVLAVSGHSLWRRHADELERAYGTAAMQARGFEDFATDRLHTTELVAASLLADGAPDPGERRFQMRLSTLLQRAPFLRSISLLDDGWRIVASSNPANIGTAVDPREFLPPDVRGQDMLRVGLPWSGRDFAGGRPASAARPDAGEVPGFVALTRTVDVQGQPRTLLFALNADYFVNHLSQVFAPGDGSASIVRYDGIVLLSTDPARLPGSRAAADGGPAFPVPSDAGRFEDQDADGRPGLGAYRSSRLYPFVLVARLDRSRALAHWRGEAGALLAVEVPSLIASALLVLWLVRRRQLVDQQRAETERLQRINATVFGASAESIVVTDERAEILSVNPAFTRITGYEAGDVLGRNPSLLASGLQDAAFYAAMWKAIAEQGLWQGELVNRRKDGTLFDAQLSITVSRDPRGRVQHYVGIMSDVTGRRREQEALRQSEERFRALTRLSSDWYWEQDDQFRFLRLDGELETKTGIPALHHVGLHRWDMPALNMTEADWDAHRALLAARQPFHGLELQRPSVAGREHWVSISGAPVFDAQGRFTGYRGVGSDITARRQAEGQLRLAASVFTHAREAIMITDAAGCILDVNTSFVRITGYARDEVLGANPRLLSSGQHGREFYTALWRELRGKGHWQGEIWNRRKSGEVYAEMLTISAVTDAAGHVRQYVAMFSDISAMKAHEQQLQYMAHYDALTQLPNRLLLADRLHQAMAQARRRGIGLAVAYLDLDGFKTVNDRHGHGVGDRLLTALAARMKLELREGDTLARVGGDEFVAVLLDLPDAGGGMPDGGGMPVLGRMLAAAAEPVDLDGIVLQVTASLGVTFFPQAQDIDAEQLLRQADNAMYEAKLAGKNCIHAFNAERDRSMRGHHETVQRLREALQREEFVLRFQPKVDLRTGRVVGAEALIRWQHPQLGLLPPAAFLADLEDDPLAIEVGEWVIDRALTHARQWREAGLRLPVSVNIGARQLQHPRFLQRLTQILQRHPDTPASDLSIEMLESSALEDLAHASKLIHACRAMGLEFAIDDFGTGYSSLTYLKRLPVHLLKIDQSFVRGMLDDPDDLAILVGVLGLARTFGRATLAEGVESPAHARVLLRLGCDVAQGYAISHPLPADELPAWAARWRPDPAWAATPRAGPEGVALLFASAETRAWIAAELAQAQQPLEPSRPGHDVRRGRLAEWIRHHGDCGDAAAGLGELLDQLQAAAAGLRQAAKVGHGAAALVGDSAAAVVGDSAAALVGDGAAALVGDGSAAPWQARMAALRDDLAARIERIVDSLPGEA